MEFRQKGVGKKRMSEEQLKSYYAIIPANVRYDPDLPANAKLLYAEITSLTNDKGYCWASNDYFSRLYKVSDRSIKEWLKKLEQKKYIKRQLIYKDNSNEVQERRITISTYEENFTTSGKKIHEGSEENFTRGSEENFTENNKNINNKMINPHNRNLDDLAEAKHQCMIKNMTANF